ncbi:MAG TPA: hypothetical protein VEK06_02560, partial [Myxococcota bacterium]|nr:hypothetical protein [Myxococcota bacterium]
MAIANKNIYLSINCKHSEHLFDITMTLDNAAKNQRLSLPAWAPGSYLVRDFAQHIVAINAFEQGSPCQIRKITKNCFELSNTGPNVSL